MKIALYSDLHTEFNNYGMFNINPEAEVVVFAGDIVVGKNVNFITELCSKYGDKQFIFVAGNHEFYGEDITELTKFYKEWSNSIDNLHFLDNSCVQIGEVTFHGSTLWTGFMSKGDAWRTMGKLEAERNVSDFYKIRIRGSRMSADIMEGLHKQSVNWLSQSLQSHSEVFNVVVTHFPPLVECTHPDFPDGILGTYFNNDLTDLVYEHNIGHWLYGHNHWSDDFKIMDTRFISNQKGYPREKCGEYRSDILIEV